MLQRLSIRDIVIIEALDIDFASGLCVLTGETGAGKSILLDSLGLALGVRAAGGLIRHGAAKGVVTAVFDVRGHKAVAGVLEELGVTPEESGQLLLKRVVEAGGSGRAFINDQPASVGALRRLGEMLVEIVGQHESRGLLESARHLEFLDAYARAGALRDTVAQAYAQWREAVAALEATREEAARARRDHDYLTYVERELAALAPQPGEEEQLAATRLRMMQGEKLAESLKAALTELTGARPAGAMVVAAQRQLFRVPDAVKEAAAPLIAALERAELEIAEAVSGLEGLLETFAYEPATLEKTEERLFALRDAARKYGRPVDDLPAYHAEVARQLALIEHGEANLAALEKQVAEKREAFFVAAEKLSAQRGKAAAALQKQVEKELAPLRMERVRFQVELAQLAEGQWNAGGIDRVTFMAATNPGTPLAPIAKIASGGELSRFLLALKMALKDVRPVPVLVFDEIDTGVGGAVADAIGQRLSALADKGQVMVVTHQPQVAAHGAQHYRIAKRAKGKSVQTEVHKLSGDERKEEIARMLAGASITDEARAAAEKLLAEV